MRRGSESLAVVSLHRRSVTWSLRTATFSSAILWAYIVKNDQELALEVDQGILHGRPHWDMVFKGSKRTELAFFYACRSSHVVKEGNVSG